MSAIPLADASVGSLLSLLPAVPSQSPVTSLRNGRRDLFEPVDDPASSYRLPKNVRRAAIALLRHFPSRESGYRLLSFLCRFQAHPENLGRLFPVDRRSLSNHRLLGLSEGEVRGGLKVLEKAGILIREAKERRHLYQRTAEGLRRTPNHFSFSPLFHTLFTTLNRWKSLKERKAQSRPVQPAMRATSEPKTNGESIKPPKVLSPGEGQRVFEKVTVTDPDSGLEQALALLRRAVLRE